MQTRNRSRNDREIGEALDWGARTHHEVPERLHNLLRGLPELAVSNCPAVDLNDGRDFRRGAGDECLVRGPDIIQGEELLLRRQVEAGSEFEDRLTRDSEQLR